MNSNLLAKRILNNFKELFTEGQSYPIEAISPNRRMALVVTDQGTHCHVSINNSVYGDFEVSQ